VDIWSLYEFPVWVTALVVAALFLLALESGFRLGSWTSKDGTERQEEEGADIALTSMLALLGLVLAFTYSFALSRADSRKQAIIKEANAIGTAFLRADLAPEPYRTELRAALRDYAQSRVTSRDTVATREKLQEALARSLKIQAQLWPLTARMVKGGYSGPIGASIVQSINEVIDMHSLRYAVSMDRLPAAVFGMLLFIGAASLFITGFSAGRRDRMNRWRLVFLSVVLAAVITVITDFDRGRSGLVKLSQQSIIDLIQDMNAELSKK
jgi:hypothetical protein